MSINIYGFENPLFVRVNPMRPEISGQLEERLERVYEGAGYATPSELVRDAVRRRVSSLEDELGVSAGGYELFKYETHSTTKSDAMTIDLKPTTNSGLKLRYMNKGNPPHHVVLSTGEEKIREHQLESALENIDGVSAAGFMTKPCIRISIWKDADRPFSAIVEDVFEALYELVGRGSVAEVEQDRVDQLSKAVERYASSM